MATPIVYSRWGVQILPAAVLRSNMERCKHNKLINVTMYNADAYITPNKIVKAICDDCKEDMTMVVASQEVLIMYKE